MKIHDNTIALNTVIDHQIMNYGLAKLNLYYDME